MAMSACQLVRGRDRDRVDRGIIEQFSNVNERSGIACDLSAPLVQHGLVDVAERGDLDLRHARERVDVILPAAAKAAHADPHAIVGAKHAIRPRDERGRSRFQEFTSRRRPFG